MLFYDFYIPVYFFAYFTNFCRGGKIKVIYDKTVYELTGEYYYSNLQKHPSFSGPFYASIFILIIGQTKRSHDQRTFRSLYLASNPVNHYRRNKSMECIVRRIIIYF